MQKFFATCPKGLESLLFNELNALQASSVKETVAGVSFSGDMNLAMRVCLYSRFASRILLVLNTFRCEDDSDLYMGAHGIGYENYFSCDKTIAVTFNGTNNSIRNTQYGALRVKDAVCDRFVDSKLERPNVDKHNPEVHIVATLKKGEVSVSLDLSGSAQFWREYHRSTGKAPLKENLAAAMVTRAGYTGADNFVDPMCGSGTLLLEAAAIATDTAAGLMRSDYGFKHLKDYDESAWSAILSEAQERSEAGKAKAKERGIKLYGFDADEYVIERAKENIANAGFEDFISVEHRPLDQLINPLTEVNDLPCTVVTNPPYGERMGNFNELILLYTTLGHKLKTCFAGGKAAVISTSTELLSCLRLSVDKSYRLFNGALECQLRTFKLDRAQIALESGQFDNLDQNAINQGGANAYAAMNAQAEVAVDFSNRLTKNLKNLSKWADKEKITAYRVYDADLPDYNAAIDRYNQYYVIQEYQAPATIKEFVAQKRLLDMIAATIKVTGAAGDNVIVKSREKQKGDSQYEKREDAVGHFMDVYEADIAFRVNLRDYLDTGLFLDARPIRRLIRKEAQGKSFLNLFAYTCTASVAAAMGGATRTLSVDMSRTYLDWGRENFILNDMDVNYSGTSASEQNHFVQADCLAYLSQDQGSTYDLIYIDPPTFSNSKRMEKSFDVQRDHLLMLGNLTRHLNDGGKVIFCTNKRNFKLHDGLEEYGFTVRNITKETFDPDFKRDMQLHTCFELTYNKASQSKEAEALVSNTMRPRWSRYLEAKQDRFTYRGEQEDRRSDRSSDRHERSFNRDSNRRRYDDRQTPARDYRRGSSSNSFERDDERKFTRESRSWGNRERTYTDRSGDEERSSRFTTSDRTDRSERSSRFGSDRNERSDRNDRFDRGSRFGSERSDRNERNDRGSRFGGERSDRGSRFGSERGKRSDRGGRFNSRDGARSTASTHKPRVWGPSGVKDIKGSEE